MREKLTKNIVALAFLFSLFSCKSEDNANYEKVSSKDTLFSEVLNFNFEYKSIEWDNRITYKTMWNGYDSQNESIIATEITQEERLYTYLTSYDTTINNYYFVYLKKPLVKTAKDNLSEIFTRDDPFPDDNYHFSSKDDENVVDGKYLYSYKKKNDYKEDDYVILSASSMEHIPFTYNNYQLVFASTYKLVTVVDNLSSKEQVHKSIRFYKRVLLKNDTSSNALVSYYLSNSIENSFDQSAERFFEKDGKYIEIAEKTAIDLSCLYLPEGLLTGFNKHYPLCLEVIVFEGQTCVKIPRYIKTSTSVYDTLNMDEFPFGVEDIFGTHKSKFKEALVADKYQENEKEIYSLFDLDKVALIIR